MKNYLAVSVANCEFWYKNFPTYQTFKVYLDKSFKPHTNQLQFTFVSTNDKNMLATLKFGQCCQN